MLKPAGMLQVKAGVSVNTWQVQRKQQRLWKATAAKQISGEGKCTVAKEVG
jgi:hypothetical protein